MKGTYSYTTLAKKLGVHRHTVRKWHNDGKIIASIRLPNNLYKFTEEDYKEILLTLRKSAGK